MDSMTMKAFFETVEGIESLASCEISNGQLVVTDKPIERRDQPNLSLLADLLRSEIGLSPAVREWLANLVDPRGAGEAALMFRKRTEVELAKRLFRKKGQYSDWPIAEFVKDRIGELRAEGKPKSALRQIVIGEACKKFDVSDTVVTDAITIWRAAHESLHGPYGDDAD